MRFQPSRYLDICLSGQRLRLLEKSDVLKTYPVSTSGNGPGEAMNSGCTPRGWHRVRAKIGAGSPLNAVFVGRRPTGEIYSPALGRQNPQRDWILTRILWLGGVEPGKNRYGQVDTARRYIYIHGTPDELMRGEPESHGCIRMKNADILELFESIEAGIYVYIHQ
ncbi:MAG: L,D-transpeptidase family protein [Gammaproteobacteria bacterium]